MKHTGGGGPAVAVGNDDGGDGDGGGAKAEVKLLNCEQRRKSGQEALNMCRTGSQPCLAASQKEAQGSTTVLKTHRHTERSGVPQGPVLSPMMFLLTSVTISTPDMLMLVKPI